MYFVQKFCVMTRELFQLEYILKSGSASLLWKLISTADGLSEWFADNVSDDGGGIFSFKWGDSIQKAEQTSLNTGISVRYHWLDDPDQYYFELHIDHSELTGGIVLHVSDFAEPEDQNSNIELWNAQIDTLIRRAGM